MSFILPCLLGLIAGAAGSLTSRASSFGLFTDLVTGVVGACLATVLLAQIGWRAPFGAAGLGGVALLGAVGAVALMRAVHHIVAPPEPTRRPGARRR